MQDSKYRHLGTIAQICRAISLQLRHVSTIGKSVKQQYLLRMSLEYGEFRPTSGWDLLANLRHPCKFLRVSRFDSDTARHSSRPLVSVSQTAALNRGRHLYSEEQPSRWALGYILVISFSATVHRWNRVLYENVTCIMFNYSNRMPDAYHV